MKRISYIRQLSLVFLIALAFYAGAFYLIERQRTRQGPWQVLFAGVTNGPPRIVINQPKLGLTNVNLVFAGEHAELPAPALMSFNEARAVPFDVPFGRCVFLDTTTLPGTVVLSLFRHEVQLLPRVLTLDRQERPWRSGETITLGQAK